MQVAKVCTSGLEYTIEEFIDSLTRSIAEEDNELLERMEAYEYYQKYQLFAFRIRD
ncbi:hypothetical protein [Lacrimispora sphenoides]|nr:hypothetical protein [Lacrimispora sphenoides]